MALGHPTSPSSPGFFFESAPSTSDNKLPTFITARLNTFLNLPHTSPLTSSFLFSALTSELFHPSHPISVPSLLHSIALNTLRELNSPNGPERALSATDVLYTPVHLTSDHILLGYVLALSSSHVPFSRGTPACDAPFAPPYVARFAFHAPSHSLTIVRRLHQPDLIALKAMRWQSGNEREQYCFALPLQEYDKVKLPPTVLALTSNLEYESCNFGFQESRLFRTWKRPPPPRMQRRPMPPLPSKRVPMRTHVRDADVDVQGSSSFLSDLLRDAGVAHRPGLFCFTETSVPDFAVAESPDRDLFTDESMKGLDDLDRNQTHPNTPDQRSRSLWVASGNDDVADASNTEALTHSMKALQNILLGTFHGPRVRMDSLQVLTGHYSSMFSGKIACGLQPAEEHSLTTLRHTMAQSYCLAAIALLNENRFLVDCGGSTAMHKANGSRVEREENGDLVNVRWESNVTSGALVDASREDILADSGGDYLSSSGATVAEVFGLTEPMHGIEVEDNLELFSRETTPGQLGLSASESAQVRPIAAKRWICSDGVGPFTGDEIGGFNTVNRAEKKSVTSSAQAKSQATADERRRRMIEERKKRNRLSAARSNFRKKQRMEGIRKEVEDNRSRISVLINKKQELTGQNRKLRTLLETGCEDVAGVRDFQAFRPWRKNPH